MGHGTVQIVDAGNAGHAHLRVMVPSMGLGIICPEQRADSLRANKNPRVRNQREEKLCSCGQSPGVTMVSGWKVKEKLPNKKPKEWPKG